jgi:hypothetical protein
MKEISFEGLLFLYSSPFIGFTVHKMLSDKRHIYSENLERADKTKSFVRASFMPVYDQRDNFLITNILNR